MKAELLPLENPYDGTKIKITFEDNTYYIIRMYDEFPKHPSSRQMNEWGIQKEKEAIGFLDYDHEQYESSDVFQKAYEIEFKLNQ